MYKFTDEEIKKIIEFAQETKKDLTTDSFQPNEDYSDRQILTMALNLPFIISAGASKTPIDKKLREELLDSSYYVKVEDLPLLSTEKEDVMTNDKFTAWWEEREERIYKGFDEHKCELIKVLKRLTKDVDDLMKYELIYKMFLVSKKDIKTNKLMDCEEWKFLEDLDVSTDEFKLEDFSLTKEEWLQICSIPSLVFYIIAAADSNISKKEISEFESFITDYYNQYNPILSNFFHSTKEATEYISSFNAVYEQERLMTYFKEAVANLNKKLPAFEAIEIKSLAFKLAYDVASSAGFLGFNFIGGQEALRISEIAEILGFNDFLGQKMEFRKEIHFGEEVISPDQFCRKVYAYKILKSLVS